jgi:hypothetical protein
MFQVIDYAIVTELTPYINLEIFSSILPLFRPSALHPIRL